MSKLEDALENFDSDDLPEDEESMLEWWDFDDADEMVAAVAGDIQFIIESALDARGDALLALPVSDEAMPVLEALAEKQIKWKHVTIIPTDDLLIPLDDPRSHVKKLAQLFLTRGARVLPLAPDHEDYHMAGAAADARLRDTKWPADLVWLGMGEGGSTAGIMESADMEEALDGPPEKLVVGLLPDDGDTPLVTLTKAAICEARTVIVLLKGAANQTVLESEIEQGATSMAPIGRIFADLAVPVDIYVEN
ncbi:6-phosphogluconolactonase [uncultured Parasphingorhabdus sp.]|uniref:6-phosphogluconolactonase n=1 Tax=uncultured Parasphingorhabdus sp. TaxID=2709694 RepID=UPI0030DB374E